MKSSLNFLQLMDLTPYSMGREAALLAIKQGRCVVYKGLIAIPHHDKDYDGKAAFEAGYLDGLKVQDHR